MQKNEDRGIAVMRGEAEARIDAAVVTLARLLGRRIAREELDRLGTANDNVPAKDASEK
ncbi:MAG: hypothetical protein OXI01_15345 [Albidovulum sp.]|nr:hypothetical protein [Albidovulum sp.]